MWDFIGSCISGWRFRGGLKFDKTVHLRRLTATTGSREPKCLASLARVEWFGVQRCRSGRGRTTGVPISRASSSLHDLQALLLPISPRGLISSLENVCHGHEPRTSHAAGKTLAHALAHSTVVMAFGHLAREGQTGQKPKGKLGVILKTGIFDGIRLGHMFQRQRTLQRHQDGRGYKRDMGGTARFPSHASGACSCRALVRDPWRNA